MIYFNCDYMAGAHPEVLEALCDTNLIKSVGYGFDSFTSEARAVILKACGLEEGEVFFLQGGTQTNKTVIDRLLSRNDGVVCCESGHINVHEAGAIEADGHKVMALAGNNGKLDASALERYMEDFYRDETNEHMVRPAMVYISHPTEYGTLYIRNELEAIRDVCRKYSMPLYVDGARLAYGLAAEVTDVSLRDIAEIADVFYIGGTKCGALFGEAVVTRHAHLLPRFMSVMKLHGALLAKGRLLGVQFLALFKDDLYLRIGLHADRLAMKLKEGMRERGYRIFIDSPTNQQFFILPNSLIDKLSESVGFELWGPRGENESIVRFVTDWSTTEEDIISLLGLCSYPS
ncbi:MAG: aminotransferase class I/II-fold pyridoxal phosphate-dependent enzyme [Muribaculaceae bacterium]|nr:aminotransferase class I/II-fold pyridoxal phosphate-dependent enzyme [Muribaculaceae bacterium]